VDWFCRWNFSSPSLASYHGVFVTLLEIIPWVCCVPEAVDLPYPLCLLVSLVDSPARCSQSLKALDAFGVGIFCFALHWLAMMSHSCPGAQVVSGLHSALMMAASLHVPVCFALACLLGVVSLMFDNLLLVPLLARCAI